MWTLTGVRDHGDGRWLDCTFEYNFDKRTLRINRRRQARPALLNSYWVRADGSTMVVVADRGLIDHLVAHWTLTGSINGFPQQDLFRD